MRKAALGGLGLLGIIVAAGLIFFLTRSSGPDAFELSTSDDTADSDTADSESADVDTGTPVTLDGQWTVSEGSQAGYRVIEDFAGGLQDFEAVGRGSDIEGFITIDGTTITEATFEVDIATITSDDNTRDNKFRGDIMSADEFPTAKFALTQPIELGEAPEPESAVSVTATGELTLRGVTNSTPVAIDAQLLSDGRVEIVGSIDVLFSDYGIANPSIERIISVRDDGKVEFQLFLTLAS